MPGNLLAEAVMEEEERVVEDEETSGKEERHKRREVKSSCSYLTVLPSGVRLVKRLEVDYSFD